ncbi:phosphopyruvate hydratase [Candidatus Woesearchaeota archaeon]|nr:phosphopyruvate hydratase [Candidatus Woesearchaeota archaeon]
MKIEIEKIKAREVLDSRGNPTVEADVIVRGKTYRAIVPSGASTGSHEAHELRDKDNRFMGKGVMKAVNNVNGEINDKVAGLNCTEQAEIDNVMIDLDGTENKDRLGANAMLAVSLAACKAGAGVSGMPLYKYINRIADLNEMSLPVPQMNVINGGRHAGLVNDLQETMLMPVKAKSFKEAVRMGSEIYHTLKKDLKDRFGPSAIHLGDEGGFAPPLKTAHERIEFLSNSIDKAGYSDDVRLALDCAASEFYSDGTYTLNGKEYNSGELIDYYDELCKTFKIASIEDGMDEDDWEGWVEMNQKLGSKIQIVGDDLLVTNPKRIEKGLEMNAINSLLLKVNQIGTLTESFKAAKMMFDKDLGVVVSHRSGETEDSFIADLTVGIGAGQLKSGATARSERLCKYNQLMRIEEELPGKFYDFKYG